jgi:hypothetical protein
MLFVPSCRSDAGGLTNEYFELLFAQLFQPQYALWEAHSEWKTFVFSTDIVDPSKAGLYMIFGLLLGMCVYNNSSISLNLPIWLYSQLLGIKPGLKELRSVDAQLTSSLEELLAFTGNIEDTFCLTFEISVKDRSKEEIRDELTRANLAAAGGTGSSSSPPPPSTASPMQIDSSSAPAPAPAPVGKQYSAHVIRNVALIPGGSDIYVTQANKHAYVAAYLEYLFTASVRDALAPMLEVSRRERRVHESGPPRAFVLLGGIVHD